MYGQLFREASAPTLRVRFCIAYASPRLSIHCHESPAYLTSAFSSSHDIHALRYALPFATVSESPTTHN